MRRRECASPPPPPLARAHGKHEPVPSGPWKSHRTESCRQTRGSTASSIGQPKDVFLPSPFINFNIHPPPSLYRSILGVFPALPSNSTPVF